MRLHKQLPRHRQSVPGPGTLRPSKTTKNPLKMLIPVLLAGGSGSRLWPLSRKLHPKQFLRLTDERSLLENTVMRVMRAPDVGPVLAIGGEALFGQRGVGVLAVPHQAGPARVRPRRGAQAQARRQGGGEGTQGVVVRGGLHARARAAARRRGGGRWWCR